MVGGQPLPLGDGVGGAETDAADVLDHPIGLLLDDEGSVLAVALADALDEARRQTEAAQEDRQGAAVFVGPPPLGDRIRPGRADAVDLGEPLRLGAQHVRRVGAEVVDDALG